MRISLAKGALALALCASVAAAAGPVSGVQAANMDLAVRPQDDLFAYANGRWLREVGIPPDRSRYGVDSVMAERSLLQQRELIEAARNSPDLEARKVGDLYASFMDEARIERAGARPLQPELARIAAIRSASDLGPAMAHLDRIGVASPIGSYVEVDARRPQRYALWLSQGGLGLPDGDYYSSDDPSMTAVRARYRAHVAALLRLLGDAHPDQQADDILALETRVARLQWKPVDRRDPAKTYNPRTLAELEQLAPRIGWKGFLAAEGLSAMRPVLIIREPDYLTGLSGLLESTPVSVWKAYLRLRLVSDAAPYLSRAFVEEDFAFNEGVLHDTPKLAERWKRGCALVDRLMGEASGKLYVARYFPPRSKARVDAMTDNLITAYAESLGRLDWLSPATRAAARAKLRQIKVKIGYPTRWRAYGKLTISPVDLLGNVLQAQQFETDRKHAQLVGRVDRGEWRMTAPTVDAYYSPATNEVAFPAGVLQAPLFDPAADDAYNYGSTGATIGHEISHGFDNRGSQYDGAGNLRDWWTAEDHARFKARTDRLVRQFDAFEPAPGVHVNGALTLPETIGDLAGLEIAHQAYLASLHGQAAPVIDGLTGDQRFFIGYAQSFLGKRRQALLIAQLNSNPHAPEAYRVNGVVAHMASFYAAFGVKPGDRMYLPPEDRVTLW